MESQIEKVIQRIRNLYKEKNRSEIQNDNSKRILISIAGSPGSGKTALSSYLALRLNQYEKNSVIAISMDGFHLTRKELDQMSNSADAHKRRGSEFTFDVDGYSQMIQNLKDNDKEVWAPGFDHSIKDPVEKAVLIKNSHRIVIVEGNYTALNIGKWNQAASLFDLVIFVNVDFDIARKRLATRHLKAGIVSSIEDGIDRANENDLINGKQIVENKVQGLEQIEIESVEDQEWILKVDL